MGDIVYKDEKKNEDYAEVQLIECEFDELSYNKEELNFRKEPCMPKMINNICNYLPRTELIIELTLKYNKEGRNVLILSDRRGHLVTISELLEKHNFLNYGFYVGGMKEKDLKESQLDFFYLTSPLIIEKKIEHLDANKYFPMEFSNIFLTLFLFNLNL